MKGWSGQKSDWPIRFLGHEFLIAPHTFQTSKSNSKGDIEQNPILGTFRALKFAQSPSVQEKVMSGALPSPKKLFHIILATQLERNRAKRGKKPIF